MTPKIGMAGSYYTSPTTSVTSTRATTRTTTALVILAAVITLGGTITTTAAYAWNFTADGDWGCKTSTEITVERMQARNPERVLGLGDLSYEDTPDCWLDIISPLDSRMRIAIGNHDDETAEKLNVYIDHFNLQKQYYSFDYGRAHFLVLSTELVSDTAQLNFARKDLQRTAADPSIDWVFAYMHKPMYTSPTGHAAVAAMRDTYHPLFDRYDVDIVLNGHNHNYERSYPITYDDVGNPATPIVTTTETTNYNDPEGAIFATVGTGGFSLHQFTGKASYIVTQQDDQYGFLDVSISSSGDSDTLTARYFVTTSTGLLTVDRFTITK
jgi:predicted phosphodiesterase